MDTQSQQQPTLLQMPQEELQPLIALVLRVMVQLDDRTLSQLRENQQSIDEVAQAVAQAVHQTAQSFIPPQPEWTVEERRIEDLVDEEDMERMIDNGDSFGNSYTRVNRNGDQVLHMLSEHYDESVLEAAKEDDLHPPSNRGVSISTVIYVGNQYAALVHGGGNVTPKTLEVMRSNFERQKEPYRFTPSLTNSSQPRIGYPTYIKGASRARQSSDFK